MTKLTGGQKNYRRFAIASFVAIYLLVLIGGTVRITGSGMGCPDWPKCFGRIIPPTDVSQLPADYQARYADRGYQTMEFNAVKTWIEYINRLFSAVIVGPLAIAMLLFSFSWRRQDPAFIYFSTGILVLILFEAWLGKTVVDSNLSHSKITMHLIGAMLILALSAAAIVRTDRYSEGKLRALPQGIKVIAMVTLLLLAGQMIAGTFVREEIDTISKNIDPRNEWAALAVKYLPFHRIFSWIVTLVTGLLIFRIYRQEAAGKNVRFWGGILGASLAGQLLTGLLLNNFGFPAAAQLLHLGLSMAMFTALIFILMYGTVKAGRAQAENLKAVYIA